MLQFFLAFNGEANEVLIYYKEVFSAKILNVMKYDDMPQDDVNKIDPSNEGKIAFSEIEICGTKISIMDNPIEMGKVTMGDNFVITLTYDTEEEVKEVFNRLKEEGEVFMELEETFYAKLYGSIKDKFGIWWSIMLPQYENNN